MRRRIATPAPSDKHQPAAHASPADAQAASAASRCSADGEAAPTGFHAVGP